MKVFSIFPIVLTAVGFSAQALAADSYARVYSTGAPVSHSADITNVAKADTGVYRISFNRDINACVSVVTPTYFGVANEPAIQGATATTQPQNTDLVVFTSGQGNVHQDHGFVVLIHCP